MPERWKALSPSVSRKLTGPYAIGLVLRGELSRPEVLGMRRLVDLQMSRRPFRASLSTVVEPIRIQGADGEVRGEWVERPGVNSRANAVLMFCHGGGFVAGSLRSCRGMASELARRTGVSVFSVDYRLAPEHPFPAAPDDVLRAYRWLLASGVSPTNVVVMGDSAGGHLALGLAPRAARAGLAVPAGVVAFSPIIDPSMKLRRPRALVADSHEGRLGASFGRALMRNYYGPATSTRHPELRLTSDDLSVMPPVLIQASAAEILSADAHAYIEALRASGGVGELRTWPGQSHVFQMSFRHSAVAREAFADVHQFVHSLGVNNVAEPGTSGG